MRKQTGALWQLLYSNGLQPFLCLHTNKIKYETGKHAPLMLPTPIWPISPPFVFSQQPFEVAAWARPALGATGQDSKKRLCRIRSRTQYWKGNLITGLDPSPFLKGFERMAASLPKRLCDPIGVTAYRLKNAAVQFCAADILKFLKEFLSGSRKTPYPGGLCYVNIT